MEYWQEVGRVGRNGQAATAVCFILPYLSNASQSMKDLVISVRDGKEKCIRKCILKELNSTVTEKPKSNALCNKNCALCSCAHCLCCSSCKKFVHV